MTLVNDSLPINYRVPGIYFKFIFNSSGPALPNKKLLLLGYRLSSADSTPGGVYPLPSQAEADRRSGGRNTDLSRMYAAATSQLSSGSGVTIFGVPIDAPAAGVAATHLLWFRQPFVNSTSAVDTTLTAQAPGLINTWVCGLNISVAVLSGDSFNAIAANYLLAAARYLPYIPATPSIIGETVTMGVGNSQFTFTALDNPESVVVSQQTGNTKALSATYAAGVLTIALGTDGGGAPNTIGSALKTALDAVTPALAGHIAYGFGAGNGSGIITTTLALTLLPFACVCWTMLHKGLVGNPFPIRVSPSNTAMRVGVVAGKLTFAGNAANPAGQHGLQVNTWSDTFAPTNAETPAAVAQAWALQLNTEQLPVQAGFSGAELWLYYRDQRIVHKITASTTDSSQTIIVTDRVTAGALATMTASQGTPTTLQGQGAPNLTAALTTLISQDAFLVWAHPFLDAQSLGLIAQHVEKYQDSPYDKGQRVHVCSDDGLLTAAAIPPSSSPALTSSPRYVVTWCQGSWEQPHEHACRTAALVCQLVDYPPKNYDGQVLHGTSEVPVHAPDLIDRPGVDDRNNAMGTYYLTPLIGDSNGNLAIDSDTTTWKPGDQRLVRWGGILTMDYDRDSLKAWLAPVVKGKNIKAYSDSYTPNTVTPERLIVATQSWMKEMDNLDIYDGSELLFPQVQGQGNVQNPARYDLQLPMRWPSPLSVLGIVGFLAPQ